MKRYYIYSDYGQRISYEEHDKGSWVKWKDVKAKLEEIKEERDTFSKNMWYMVDERDKEIKRLKKDNEQLIQANRNLRCVLSEANEELVTKDKFINLVKTALERI